MKNLYIKDLEEGLEIIDFFVVRASDIKVGGNGKKYVDITLGDSSGDLTGKKWDVSPSEEPALGAIKAGDIVKVKATITSFRDARQFRITRIRQATSEDDLNMKDFVKAAPELGKDMMEFLTDRIDAMEDEELKLFCSTIIERNREKLLYYPAAVRNHHAELSGLLWHIKRMILHGDAVCKIYPILNPDLLAAGVIIHDIEKLTEIQSNEMGVSDGYSFEGKLLGHLVQGVKVVDRLARELGISEEKALMLQHMILSHHYEADFGSPKKPLFPEAEMLHYLDITDSKMYDVEEALDVVKPGDFSERVWTLDNRQLYKAKF